MFVQDYFLYMRLRISLWLSFQLCTLKKELRPSIAPTYRARPGVQRTMSQGTGSLYSGIQSFGGIHDPTGFAMAGTPGLHGIAEGSIEMQKIKKVQSFFRGWLCRRRWKQIVEQYIKSPHAESMRKRNRFIYYIYNYRNAITSNLFADLIFRLMICHVFTNFIAIVFRATVLIAITKRNEKHHRKFQRHFNILNDIIILRDKIM